MNPGSVPAGPAVSSGGGGKKHCGSSIAGGGSPGLAWWAGVLALLPVVLRRRARPWYNHPEPRSDGGLGWVGPGFSFS